jgi:hypothetical protein
LIELHYYVILALCNLITVNQLGGLPMPTNSDRLNVIRKIIYREKIVAFTVLVSSATCSAATLRRDLKTLQAPTSYTHRGSYVTLPDIPDFDNIGIWFFKGIGFSKFKNSLELIVAIVENSKDGITQAELESILRIGISKQIQILMERKRLHRVKIGAQYVYIPDKAAGNKKTRMKIVGSRQIEEHYDREITINDLVTILKVVLREGRIEMKHLKRWIKKYALKIPAAKLERIILKYDLNEKKTP